MLEIPDTPDMPESYKEEALAATNRAITLGRASALLALSELKSKWESDQHFTDRVDLLTRSILCQKLVACVLDESPKDIGLISLCLVEMAESEQFEELELIYAGQAAFGLFSDDDMAKQTLFEDLSNQKTPMKHVPRWSELVVKMTE